MVAHHICPQGCLIFANVIKTTNTAIVLFNTIGMTIKGDRKYPINCIILYLEQLLKNNFLMYVNH